MAKAKAALPVIPGVVPTGKSVEPVMIPGAPMATWPVGPLVLGFGGAGGVPWFVIGTTSPKTVGGVTLKL